MLQRLNVEVVNYTSLDEVLRDARTPGHLVFGMEAVSHKKLPKGVVVLVGERKLGIYDADSQTLKVWDEQALTSRRAVVPPPAEAVPAEPEAESEG